MLKNSILFTILVCIAFPLFSQLSNYATLPYSTGFETGLDANWAAVTSTTGRVRIHQSGVLTWTTQTAFSHTGNYFLGLDDSTGGTFTTQQAWMGLNLAGASNVTLDFWWAEWNDESQSFDGVFLSDNGGISFTKVYDFNPASVADLTWQHFNWDLDSIAIVHNLNFSSTFVVNFQQHDNYYFAGGNDGFLFDDISVTGTVCANDTMVPTAVCQDISVQLAANGTASITAADIDNGSTDDCIIASMMLSQTQFTCANLGPNTVSLTVTDPSGQNGACTAVVMVQDTAGLTTVPVNLGADQNICGSDIVPLDAGASPTSYLWNNGDTARTIFVGPGSYSVIVSNANGCTGTDSITLGMIPVPSPNLTAIGRSTATLCVGDTLTLAADSGFAAYQWSTGSMTNTTEVSTGGTVSLVVVDINGCTRTDSVVVTQSNTARPAPVITPSPIAYACDGGLAILDAGTGFSSYDWSSGDISQVTGVNAGTYTVTVTNSLGCWGTSGPVEVRDTTSTPTTITQTVDTLCASSAMSYAWLLNGTPTGQSTQCITATTNGTYTVVTTNEAGCESSDSISFMVGIAENNLGAPQVSIAPNPFKELTRITFQLEHATNVRLEVLDLEGRTVQVVYDGPVAAGQSYSQEVNPEGMSAGVYFYRLAAENGQFATGKMVLMK